MSLPPGFWTERKAILTSFNMIASLITHIKYKIKEHQRLLAELEDFTYQRQNYCCHASSVSAYRKLLTAYKRDTSDRSITVNNENTYLFFDTVHKMKHIKNNLLARKKIWFRLSIQTPCTTQFQLLKGSFHQLCCIKLWERQKMLRQSARCT